MASAGDVGLGTSGLQGQTFLRSACPVSMCIFRVHMRPILNTSRDWGSFPKHLVFTLPLHSVTEVASDTAVTQHRWVPEALPAEAN